MKIESSRLRDYDCESKIERLRIVAHQKGFVLEVRIKGLAPTIPALSTRKQIREWASVNLLLEWIAAQCPNWLADNNGEIVTVIAHKNKTTDTKNSPAVTAADPVELPEGRYAATLEEAAAMGVTPGDDDAEELKAMGFDEE